MTSPKPNRTSDRRKGDICVINCRIYNSLLLRCVDPISYASARRARLLSSIADTVSSGGPENVTNACWPGIEGLGLPLIQSCAHIGLNAIDLSRKSVAYDVGFCRKRLFVHSGYAFKHCHRE